MNAFVVTDGKVQRAQSLYDALKINDGGKTIAFVGGGGKTTLTYALAAELQARAKRVVVTTTTHIRKPTDFFVTDGDIAQVQYVLEDKQIVVAGRDCGEGKLAAVDDAFFEALRENCDCLLVEADGSRGLPFKIPAEHEPVLPKGVDLVVGVAGIDALGQKLGVCCHRAELTADFLGKSLDSLIEEKDFAAIFQSNQGSRKKVNCRFQAIIHKVNDVAGFESVKKISRFFPEPIVGTGRFL